MTEIKYSVEFHAVKYKKYKPGAPKHLLKQGGRWQKAGEYGGFDNIDNVPSILTDNKSMYKAAPAMYDMLNEVSKLRDSNMEDATQWILDNTDDLIYLLAKARGQ